MKHLYLNFQENLDKGSKSRDDFYTTSLKDQFEVIKKKLSLPINNLEEFLIYAFPPEKGKNYFISMPSFDRRVKQNRCGKDTIFNIVIRPEMDSYLSSIMPKKYDLIAIGDVTFGGKVIDISIKGIDVIDSKVAKFGEIKVQCCAAYATKEKMISVGGKTIFVADYGNIDLHDSLLTPDFVDRLCNEKDCYPVPEPEKALNIFSKWQEYIKFRKYYLGKLSERCEDTSNVSVCDAYMVTKETYRRNEEEFSEFLFDDIKEFARGEQIILSKNVSGSESFPLIKVEIEKNRKEVLSETIGRFANGKSKYEVNLQRYTRDAMSLSSIKPEYDENGNNKKGFRFSQYPLGERYLLTHVDIEPDCTDLEDKFESTDKAESRKIDDRYEGIIINDLNRFMEMERPIIHQKYESLYKKYVGELDASFGNDVLKNSDKEVQKEFEDERKKISSSFDEEIKKLNKEIELQSKKAKGKYKDEELNLLIKAKQSQINEIEQEKKDALAKISLRELYLARNKKLIENKRKSLAIQEQAELDRLSKDKRRQLEIQYRDEITNEKNQIHSSLKEKLESDKAIRIENETIRRYQIYFKPDSTSERISEIEKEIESIGAKYLIYDNRAEKAKIERQEKALNAFMGGYVRNPFLPTYLFSPESLAKAPIDVAKDPDWCLESLNDTQKLAVKKALASESIFLLQGPPGTGKTQVIAEITAQLAKQGKKVLISSETHKAIDNVFERLPKIPEIRPLRLIPSQNGKESNYSPEKLVDNFYLNISENLEKQIDRFEHFEESKEDFNEKMGLLRREYDRILRLKNESAQIEKQMETLKDSINRGNETVERYREELSTINSELEEFRRTTKCIESFRLSLDGIKEQYSVEFKEKIEKLMNSFETLKGSGFEVAGKIFSADIGEIKSELASLLSSGTMAALEERRNVLRNELQKLRDPDTDEAPIEGEEHYEEYKQKQNELRKIANKINAAKKNSEFDISSSKVYSLVPSIINQQDLLKKLPGDLLSFKIQAQSIVDEQKKYIDDAMSSYVSQKDIVESKITDAQTDISKRKASYEKLASDSTMEEYGELTSSLKQKIGRFFRDFGIIREYDSNNMEEAFSIISDEWKKLENDYSKDPKKNEKRIKVYKEICKYLGQEDILEEDRQAYTKELYSCVNVFGITCTSRDRFTKTQLAELGKYGIESVDIRTQGIDVVIIDEVSKSSFLDLLIPILYGKTIILVGDHRQLPPMYDLRHMRKDDFEGLDENIITKEINDSYTALYEECFFKTLYEKVPKDFKIMLNKQYRCHSHIMEVFNHFYGGNQNGLTVGKKQQDDEKEHNLTVRINGNTIIEPKYHVYFIDCDQKESSAYEGSTSKINEQEAEVAIQLLKRINKASEELIASKKIIVDKERKIDERLSAGIICTYGDQASLIKKKRRGQRFDGLSNKQDERLIISTVDDFQGDERDVIILSMVRNPARADKANADFIKKFERINVALSRARKLLIVIGSRKYLSEAGVIDLPDLSGDHFKDKKNFHVYQEIIDTINFRGKILTAKDIIGE